MEIPLCVGILRVYELAPTELTPTGQNDLSPTNFTTKLKMAESGAKVIFVGINSFFFSGDSVM